MSQTNQLVAHIKLLAAHYKQDAFMIHLMAQQALGRAGIEYRNVMEFTPEQLAIVTAEIERRLGGKRINGKRISS